MLTLKDMDELKEFIIDNKLVIFYFQLHGVDHVKC